MFDLSDVLMDDDFMQPVTFERVTRSFNDEGKAEETLNETVTISANVQSLSDEELQKLPEGERYLPYKQIFTVEPLTEGDYMFFEGVRWRITGVPSWSDYGYYDAIAVRYEGTESHHSEGFTVT